MSEAAADVASGETSLTRIFGRDSGVLRAQGLGVWFGAFRDGRLGRVGFLVAALVLYGLLGIAQWFLLGFLETSPFQLTPDQQPVSESVHKAAFIASLATSALTLFGILNITAKRIRAIGAPGWAGAIVLAVLTGGATLAFPGAADPWATLACLAALTVIPNGMLDGRRAN